IIDLHERPQSLSLLRTEEMHLQAEGRGGGRLPLHLGPALGIAGEPQAAVTLPSGGKPSFFFKPVVERDGVTKPLGDCGARAQLAAQASGVPGRAASQLSLLEKERVGDAHLPQMIGDGTADDAATDDDDLRGRRQIAHASSSVWYLA